MSESPVNNASGPGEQPVVAELVRDGYVEGRHRGSVVVLDGSGSVEVAVGDVRSPMLPRSCNKPLQAVGMVRAGLELPPELLALACASHSGEDVHVDFVRRILAGAGLDETDLQCPPDWPLTDDVKLAYAAAGGRPERVRMNCSGKHAAMLATCVVNGWSTSDYLRPGHPLQVEIRRAVTDLTGEEPALSTTDGCGAPLLSTSLTGLARGFARVATATAGPEALVAEAVRSHPALVSGTSRDELVLIEAVPGLVAKAGAEACYAVALADGRAAALKIDDGGARARPVVMAAVVEWLLDRQEVPGADLPAVRSTGEYVVLGGGRPLGSLRPTLPLR